MPPGLLPMGRPETSVMKMRYRLQQLLEKTSTDEDLLEVWDHVTDMAKSSTDIQWAVLYLAYRLGKPASNDPKQQAGIQIDGDLTLNINQLSLEQIDAAQKAIETIDATFSRSPDALALPHPH